MDLYEMTEDQLDDELVRYGNLDEEGQVEHLAGWANVMAEHSPRALVDVLGGSTLGRYMVAIGMAIKAKDDGYIPAVWRQSDTVVGVIEGPMRPAGLEKLFDLGWAPDADPAEVARRLAEPQPAQEPTPVDPMAELIAEVEQEMTKQRAEEERMAAWRKSMGYNECRICGRATPDDLCFMHATTPAQRERMGELAHKALGRAVRETNRRFGI